jgi:hypothetical protein
MERANPGVDVHRGRPVLHPRQPRGAGAMGCDEGGDPGKGVASFCCRNSLSPHSVMTRFFLLL